MIQFVGYWITPTNLPFSAYQSPGLAGSIHNNFVRPKSAKDVRRFRKVAKNSSHIRHVRPSVCPHVSERLPPDIFPWNLISETFTKTYWENPKFICREEKPIRCHWMVYCTYNMLNMFRTLLCPSSGARDYMCVITAYVAQCLVAGCRGSGAGQQAMHPGRGMFMDKNFFFLCSWFHASQVYINKCPTRCNNMQSIFYFTAISLYVFRVPSAPIIRST